MLTALQDTVPVLALVALLVTAYRHLPGRLEALIGVVAAGVAFASGRLGIAAVRTETGHLLPVVVFLAAILVVAECCRSEGLFTAIGQRVARLARPRSMLAATFGVATITTVALSLDATVVLLTPVVVVGAASAGLDSRPTQLTTVRLANSASLLLPVSNLTNLLALRFLDLSFAHFALLMLPSWLVVLAVEYVVLRGRFRTELAAPGHPVDGAVIPLPSFPLVVIAVMLVVFAATSPLGVAPAWPAVAAAVVLAVRALARGRQTWREVLLSAHLGFAVFVLCLGIVVAVLNATDLGGVVRRAVPGDASVGNLLLLALIGVVLTNLANNLPATLVLLPLVAPLGTTAVLATLIGINVGSSLTWTGSLANLLWRRTLRRSGVEASSRDFHTVGLIASPVGIVLGVLVLAGWAHLLP